MPCHQKNKLRLLVLAILLSFSNIIEAQNICSFPPQIIGGQVKVLKLLPLKTVKYSCQKGYHLWGQEIVQCDPDKGGWPAKVQAQCVVDSAESKIAFASSRNSQRTDIPLINSNWNEKHQGKPERLALIYFSAVACLTRLAGRRC